MLLESYQVKPFHLWMIPSIQISWNQYLPSVGILYYFLHNENAWIPIFFFATKLRDFKQRTTNSISKLFYISTFILQIHLLGGCPLATLSLLLRLFIPCGFTLTNWLHWLNNRGNVYRCNLAFASNNQCHGFSIEIVGIFDTPSSEYSNVLRWGAPCEHLVWPTRY